MLITEQRKLFIILILLNILNIVGCAKNINLESFNKSNQTSNKLIAFRSLENIQEYVTRIGKRLLIVSNYPNIRSTQFKFVVNNQNFPGLTIEYQFKSLLPQIIIININKGLLDYLEDEAELATILAINLDRLNYHDFNDPDLDLNLKADHRIIQHIYRAGYDPNAFLELEKEYHKTQLLPKNWLNDIFANTRINLSRINHNHKTILKLPKGLQRNKESFLSNIYLLQN